MGILDDDYVWLWLRLMQSKNLLPNYYFDDEASNASNQLIQFCLRPEDCRTMRGCTGESGVKKKQPYKKGMTWYFGNFGIVLSL